MRCKLCDKRIRSVPKDNHNWSKQNCNRCHYLGWLRPYGPTTYAMKRKHLNKAISIKNQ